MTGRLRIRRPDGLAPMAWCVRLAGVRNGIDLWCGNRVETGEDWFFEGAWAGAFGAAGFASAPERFGSGGRLDPHGLLLVPTSHTLERVYGVRVKEAVLASNSLAFLLAAAGLRLDVRYPDYQRKLWSVILGRRRCARSLPTREGPRVRLIYADPVRIDGRGRWRTEPAPRPPAWTGFRGYRGYLAGGVAAVLANAADPVREHRLEPVLSMSRGYDSTCAAVLAAEAGCRRALTFPDGFTYTSTLAAVDDSGAENAARLGIDAREVSYRGAAAVPEPVAAEFAACGDSVDLKFSALEPFLRDRVMVTGVRGGMIWDVAPQRPFDRFSCKDPCASSLEEFRLRIGFSHLPVPLIGVARRADTYAVTHEAGMEGFHWGPGGYARPIARRVIEEAGIPRDAFASVKAGAFDAVMMHAESRTPYPGFEEFFARHRHALGGWRGAWLLARNRWSRLRARHGSPRRKFLVVRRGRAPLLLPWGNEVVRARYAAALNGDPGGRTSG